MHHDITTVWESLRMQLDAHRLPADDTARQPGRVSLPVCLITGFLGSGKSTVLAHALQNPGHRRIRAVVNDVGRLPFDPTLVEFADSTEVELANGCGCCAMTADLAESLRAQADRGGCDLLILEASGAADPRAVAQVVHADPSLSLDRIVAVVAAEHVLRLDNCEFAPTVRRQLDSAQCVIVSGCDRVTDEEAKLALEIAGILCPGRTVCSSSPRDVASRVLLPDFPRGMNPMPDPSRLEHHELHVVTVDRPVAVRKATLVAALDEALPSLVRAKGRLCVDEVVMSVQVATSRIDVHPCDTAGTGITLMTHDPASLENLLRLLGGL